MNIRAQLRHLRPSVRAKDWPLQVIPRTPWADQRPTFREAQPAVIDAALQRCRRQPTGNWYAFAASTHVERGRPLGRASPASISSPGATPAVRCASGRAVAPTSGPTWPPGPYVGAR